MARVMRQRMLPAALAGVLFGALAMNVIGPATADHQPANKVAVSGSGLEVLRVSTLAGPETDAVMVASGTMRTSAPTDLIIEATAECALITDITTMNNQDSRAFAQVKFFVVLDGEIVPVASDDTEDTGKVVFCDREYRRIFTTDSEDEFNIETFLDTRSANAFNWITLNVGKGIHSIELWAELSVDRDGTGTGRAEAAVGKRTLVVQPVKLANDATI